MSKAGKFWQQVQKQSKAQSPEMVALCEILSVNPLVFSYKGVEISAANGDNIYVDPLIIQANINLDVSSMDSAQTINPALWEADNTPTEKVEISGTQKQFITDFYNFYKTWQGVYIINAGDFVAVQKLGNNTYIVLRKAVKIDG